MDTEPLKRERLGEPLAQQRGRAGMRPPKLPGEPVKAVQRGGMVGELPGGSQSPLDTGAVAFGKVIEDVALLVADAPLDRDRTKYLVDGRPQRLAAGEDDEHALLDIEAPVDEVGEDVPRDGLVLRRAVNLSRFEWCPQ